MGREIKVWKFCTMIPNSDQVLAEHLQRSPDLRSEWKAHYKLKNDPRVTRVGKILRRLSLDELPQLWNILKGDMSLVGPRPATPREVARCGPHGLRRLEAKPGLTGLWQVSGKNRTTFEEMVRLDITYGRHVSFLMDIIIILKTLPAILVQLWDGLLPKLAARSSA